jgi:hypothetical protein
MAKWKLFGKPRPTEEKEDVKEEPASEETETVQTSGNEPLAEYNETLFTGTSKTSKGKTSQTSTDQRIWRNVSDIERKVDNLHVTKARKPVTELDRTVDKIIEKSK